MFRALPGMMKMEPPPKTCTRFAIPKSEEEVLEARKHAVPKRTSEYCIRVWDAWRESSGYVVPSILEMDTKILAHWLTRFVLEVRKVDGSEYPPNTLHPIICGISYATSAMQFQTRDRFFQGCRIYKLHIQV